MRLSPIALLGAPVPRRHWTYFRPKPPTLNSGGSLRIGIADPVLERLLVLVLVVVPRIPLTHLLQVYVDLVDKHFANMPFVAILLAALRESEAAEHQQRQVGLRLLTKGLALLRRVNASKANFVLLALGVEQGDGVAVCNAHNAAMQGRSRG